MKEVLPKQDPRLITHIIEPIRQAVSASPDTQTVHIGFQSHFDNFFRTLFLIASRLIIQRRHIGPPQAKRHPVYLKMKIAQSFYPAKANSPADTACFPSIHHQNHG